MPKVPVMDSESFGSTRCSNRSRATQIVLEKGKKRIGTITTTATLAIINGTIWTSGSVTASHPTSSPMNARPVTP